VREVDELEDPVNERVAERDERVDGAVPDPDQADRREARRVLDEVDEEPDADEGEEREPDQREEARAGPIKKPRQARRGFARGRDCDG
jgi:hypothetical protein